VFAKDQFSGNFVNEWDLAFGKSSAKGELVDVSIDLAQLLAVKDAEEIVSCQYVDKMGLFTLMIIA
jgi:nucleosome binding factor SPN SPT16 subunit